MRGEGGRGGGGERGGGEGGGGVRISERQATKSLVPSWNVLQSTDPSSPVHMIDSALWQAARTASRDFGPMSKAYHSSGTFLESRAFRRGCQYARTKLKNIGRVVQ
jgi:hypothetical protein